MSEFSIGSYRRSAIKSITFQEPARIPSTPTVLSVDNFNQRSIAKQREHIKSILEQLSSECNIVVFIIYLLLCFNWYMLGIQWFPDQRIAPEMECNITELQHLDWTFYERRNVSCPKNDDYIPGCVYYNYSYNLFNLLTYEGAEDLIATIKERPLILKCQNIIIYKDVPKEISYLKTFDVVCIGREMQTPNLFGHYGIMIMALPCGLYADMYGRKPVYIFTSIVTVLSSFIIVASPSYSIMLIAKSFLCGCMIAMNIILGTLYSEIILHSSRSANIILAYLFFVSGITIASSSRVRNLIEVWKMRTLVFAISSSIFLVGTMIIVESPRYLMKKRQFKKAWLVLQELGWNGYVPDVVDYTVSKPSIKYQMKIFTKFYLLHRILAASFLSGVTIFFAILFGSSRKIIWSANEWMKVKLFFIHLFIQIVVGIMSYRYSKKTLIWLFYILLSISIWCFMGSQNVDKKESVYSAVSGTAAFTFIVPIYILCYSYLIEVVPTSHRTSSMGIFFTFMHALQGTGILFKNQLELSKDAHSWFAFYCGICLMCVIISVISPESTEELPDRRRDLIYDSFSRHQSSSTISLSSSESRSDLESDSSLN